MFSEFNRIIPKTILCSQTGEKLKLHGGGKSIRSFIHIEDVINAISQLIKTGNIGDIYHIAPRTKEISIYKLVNLICDIMGYDFKSSVKLVSENYGQDLSYILNSDKIRNVTNWSEKISLENGIKETINWVNTHWAIINKMPHEYIHKV